MITYIIIDDEHIAHDIIKGYCDMLPNLEFKADCYDAIEAIDYLQKEEVDLIFLDLNMPKKSGIECLNEIKANSKMSEIAIAIYSTSASEEDIEETFVLGANIYIKKRRPFSRPFKVIDVRENYSSSANLLK